MYFQVSLTSQIASLKTKMSGFESELEEASKKQNEMKAKVKKLKEERDSTKERLESASSTASGLLFFCFKVFDTLMGSLL